MTELSTAPVLSTPAEYTFQDPPPPTTELRTGDELASIYEIGRTAREINGGGWNRVALQFPDSMLCDASWVAEALTTALGGSDSHRVYILADTSYSACCVDEIAAEHADAQVVVHYGRSCLSPTSRLPVIYVFTRHTLDIERAAEAFRKEFPDKEKRIVVMADVTYQDHVVPLASKLRAAGYTQLLHTQVVHDPAGTIPNRSIVDSSSREAPQTDLSQYSLFHISAPPPALLLALQTRMASLHVLSTPSLSTDDPTRTTNALLRRRFARVLTLAAAGVVGILVNTLSVSNYLGSVDLLKRRIAEAGKKSYTVVVGKLNAAKLANFAEVDGWVVVGCWESGLVEEDAGFFKPVITPFEMEVALKPESERVWGLEWWGGIEKMDHNAARQDDNDDNNNDDDDDDDDEDESAPPEYDLRTGRLVASRPMRRMPIRSADGGPKKMDGERSVEAAATAGQSALVKREVGEMATINGVLSPGAEYLRSQRTWQGLGTDYDDESSTVVEEGRSGVARGYTVGEDTGRA
ncbi:diphthamide biosynthesis protein 2 [Colletotrichum caudatum]|nr:diphthamide biosynthesis protein 2 [Colletotrichum caudatum]